MNGSLCYTRLAAIFFPLVLILALVFPREATAQEPLLLEADVARQSLSVEQGQLLNIILNRSTTAEVHVTRLASAPATLLQRGSAVTLQVAPGKSVVVTGEKVQRRGPNDISWAGPLQQRYGWATLVLTSKGISGMLRSGTPKSGFEFYEFEPLGGGLQAVIRVDASKSPPHHPPEYPEGVLHEYSRKDSSATTPDNTTAETGQDTLAPTQNSGGGGPYIDVLVAYTSSAANASGDINGLIQTAIDDANQSYQNSNIYLSLALARSVQVGYNESGHTFPEHVNFLEGTSDGEMDNVHNLRNQYDADIVVLLVNNGISCVGLASDILATPSTAFAALHYGCATGPRYVFAHEIGHLQGARHNREQDPSSEPFQYGHGYGVSNPGNGWKTIMSYDNACGGCMTAQYWSNPDVNYPPPARLWARAPTKTMPAS